MVRVGPGHFIACSLHFRCHFVPKGKICPLHPITTSHHNQREFWHEWHFGMKWLLVWSDFWYEVTSGMKRLLLWSELGHFIPELGHFIPGVISNQVSLYTKSRNKVWDLPLQISPLWIFWSTLNLFDRPLWGKDAIKERLQLGLRSIKGKGGIRFRGKLGYG